MWRQNSTAANNIYAVLRIRKESLYQAIFMTIIEFFDRAPIENIISSLTMKADKVVFVGTGKRMEKQGAELHKFLMSKGIKTEFDYVHINKHDLWGIVKTLEGIVECESECVFDLNGGEDLLLVAMGIVYERYRSHKRIEMHRYNIRSGAVSDCDGDGIVLPMPNYELSVIDNIALHGGAVRFAGFNMHLRGTMKWELDEEFKSDVLKLWGVCKISPSNWNHCIGILNEYEGNENEKHDSISSVIELKRVFSRKGGVEKLKKLLDLLARIEKTGCIYNLNLNESDLSFSYKSIQIKQCIVKAGTVLELTAMFLAMRSKCADGSRLFTDALTGVCIDWDGELHHGAESVLDVENEIDVFLMKGLIPILISCKNGLVDSDELYKLKTVANRFGGNYARRVLVTTYINSNPKSRDALRIRAKEMDIELIENVHLMTDDEFARKLYNIGNRL